MTDRDGKLDGVDRFPEKPVTVVTGPDRRIDYIPFCILPQDLTWAALARPFFLVIRSGRCRFPPNGGSHGRHGLEPTSLPDRRWGSGLRRLGAQDSCPCPGSPGDDRAVGEPGPAGPSQGPGRPGGGRRAASRHERNRFRALAARPPKPRGRQRPRPDNGARSRSGNAQGSAGSRGRRGPSEVRGRARIPVPGGGGPGDPETGDPGCAPRGVHAAPGSARRQTGARRRDRANQDASRAIGRGQGAD